MSLPMTRPWKHPQTGMYWLRKGVPAALRPLVGRREIRKSLKTRDPEQAKILFGAALLEVNRRFATLRAGQVGRPAAIDKVLSEREAHESACWMFDFWLAKYRENPSSQSFWPTSLYPALWRARIVPGLTSWVTEPAHAPLSPREAVQLQDLESWCRKQADDFAAVRCWQLDEVGRTRLAKALGASVQRASLTLEAEARGEFHTEVGQAVSRPAERGSEARSPSSPGVTISELLAGWWREAQAAGRKPSTFQSYQHTATSFIAFLKHDDASRVTAHDVVRFKDHRLSTPSTKTGQLPRAKTVKDSDLSALKTIFGWAASNHRIKNNPASGITIKLSKSAQLRSKGFTDDEAKAILATAMRHSNPKESSYTAAAKRWVPWLCAYTGARVGEIAQLRKEDIRFIDDHWTLRITPECQSAFKTDPISASNIDPFRARMLG